METALTTKLLMISILQNKEIFAHKYYVVVYIVHDIFTTLNTSVISSFHNELALLKDILWKMIRSKIQEPLQLSNL